MVLVPPAVHLRLRGGIRLGAFTGFAFGVGIGSVWGGAWGCCGWEDVDIDRNVNINRNNVYNRWDQRQVRSNLESRAQNLTPQQRQQVQQRAQSGRQAQQAMQGRGTRSNDVYAGRDGSAYRRGADGWERNGGQGWNKADFAGSRESATDLNRKQRARSVGASRESSHAQRNVSAGRSGGT